MYGFALAAVETRFTVSSNDANKHKRTILKYVKVLSYLLRRYDTKAEVTKADEEIWNF